MDGQGVLSLGLVRWCNGGLRGNEASAGICFRDCGVERLDLMRTVLEELGCGAFRGAKALVDV